MRSYLDPADHVLHFGEFLHGGDAGVGEALVELKEVGSEHPGYPEFGAARGRTEWCRCTSHRRDQDQLVADLEEEAVRELGAQDHTGKRFALAVDRGRGQILQGVPGAHEQIVF